MALTNQKLVVTGQTTEQVHPLAQLPREDLDLILELVLQSGSLKELAAAYGVTYPTIRLRLDRVIERLQQVVAGKQPDRLKELLASLVERGELSISGARSVRDLVQELADSAQQPASKNA